MTSNEPDVQNKKSEKRRRKREIVLIPILGILFLALTLIAFKISSSDQMPFTHAIFFFGLVNFNIVLLLLLLFLIFRNVVKVFAERRGGIFGHSLKSKLITAFGFYAIVPTAIIFTISTLYINSSFDKWFSDRVKSVLKNSLEVTHEFYTSTKRKNFHFALKMAEDWDSSWSAARKDRFIAERLKDYRLDVVEYYPEILGPRKIAVSPEKLMTDAPRVPLEVLKRSFERGHEASTIHQFGEGNLVRVLVPLGGEARDGVLVVSSFTPQSLTASMDNIATVYDEFRDARTLEHPLKSIILIMLALITLLVLMAATWLGFHLAKQLSNSLETLSRATRRISEGDYREVEVEPGSEEVEALASNFNRMVQNLERSNKQVLQANRDLQETLDRLDEHSRYIQVILANVSAGVISVDPYGRITTVNQRALEILGLDDGDYQGSRVGSVLASIDENLFEELTVLMKKHKVHRVQKSMRLELKGRILPLQITISLMMDEKGQEVGKIIVFDDLTFVVNSQRAEAWKEVARRIAHEIKNPLTPIKLSAERLQRKFGPKVKDEAFSSSIKMIIDQTDSLKNLVNEFSEFARLPRLAPKRSNLNQIVRDIYLFYKSAHSQKVTFSLEEALELEPFEFDPEQIRRVVVNLIENSIDALRDEPSGTIEIRTEFDPEHRVVRLVVMDNGPGIETDGYEQIFEPYFSTKTWGSGLGLSIVKRIVEDHNGLVRALPRSPKGLKMVLELPFVEARGRTVEDTQESSGDLNV